MTLGKLLFLYAGWVRGKPTREALAAFGVAVGVALVFATLTANQSIGGASDQIMGRLAGSAQLQANARSPEGVEEASLNLRSTPAGVAETAFALQASAAIISHGKTVVTQLLGVSPAAVTMNTAVADVPFATNGLVLPAALAAKLDVTNRAIVTVAARGRATRVPVQAVLGTETIGPLAYSLIAAGDLQYVQRLLGLPGRVSLILARVKPGQQATARAALAQRIGPGMEVTDASSEQRLLAQALLPQNESTSFFALLGVLVGVLLAGSAMMLTMADRRDELKALRLQGFSRRQLVAIVISQGVILGATASLAGVAVGYVLAISLFAGSPDYLASAFPLGTQTTVSATLALGVWAGGVAITCLCVAPALRRPRRLHEAPHKGLQMLACGVVLAAGAMLVGSRSLVSAALLTAGLLLAVPAWLGGVVRAAEWPSWSARLRRLVIAAGSVRALETRAIALTCTAAVGVFGAVVAQSTHRDLLAGLERGYARYVGSAPIWVTSPGDDLATSSFPAGSLAERIARLPRVKMVRPYYGGWLDDAGRRVWLIARNPGVPAGELIQGRQPRPGTTALSLQLAHALHAHLGTRITVPTPQGAQRLTVVATTTNLGWSSGVMFLSPATTHAGGAAHRPHSKWTLPQVPWPRSSTQSARDSRSRPQTSAPRAPMRSPGRASSGSHRSHGCWSRRRPSQSHCDQRRDLAAARRARITTTSVVHTPTSPSRPRMGGRPRRRVRRAPRTARRHLRAPSRRRIPTRHHRLPSHLVTAGHTARGRHHARRRGHRTGPSGTRIPRGTRTTALRAGIKTVPNTLPTGIAALTAAAHYLCRLAPLARREIAFWRTRARAIHDPRLRRIALAKIDKERANVESAAFFATLAHRRWRAAVRRIVAFQLAYEYIDGINEQHRELECGRRLHSALVHAVVGAPADHGGGRYLQELVDACRAVTQSSPELLATVERVGEAQARNHSGAGLKEWAQRFAPELPWWEAAAAGISSLDVLALLACPADCHRQLPAAYVEVCALSALLDGLVDTQEDARSPNHNFARHYAGESEMTERLQALTGAAARSVRTLPDSRLHSLVLAERYSRTTLSPSPRPSPTHRLCGVPGERAVGPTRSAHASVSPYCALQWDIQLS